MDVPLAFTSRANYTILLQHLWRVHSSYEALCSAFDWRPLGIDFDSRRRSRWLAEDLALLEAMPSEENAPLPAIGTIEHALGALYVLEGSSLGGQILLREALKLPGISVTHGAQFLHGYGPKTRAYWNSFLEALDRFPPDGGAAFAIEQGAMETFQQFNIALNDRTRVHELTSGIVEKNRFLEILP